MCGIWNSCTFTSATTPSRLAVFHQRRTTTTYLLTRHRPLKGLHKKRHETRSFVAINTAETLRLGCDAKRKTCSNTRLAVCHPKEEVGVLSFHDDYHHHLLTRHKKGVAQEETRDEVLKLYSFSLPPDEVTCCRSRGGARPSLLRCHQHGTGICVCTDLRPFSSKRRTPDLDLRVNLFLLLNSAGGCHVI